MDVTDIIVLLLNFCAVIGNLAVFVWRCRKENKERYSILSMMIVHLAFFDFICGAYYLYNDFTGPDVYNITNGTLSATDYAKFKKQSYPFVFYLASFYTSGWITLSIAVYSLAVITPWKRCTTRIIAGILFLLAWIIFASATTANEYIISSEAKLDPGNKTTRWGVWSMRVYLSLETRYLFVCECLYAGFVIITCGVYLLAVLPRVSRWNNVNRSSGEQSTSSGLRARLLAIVIVNLLCALLVIGFLASCWHLIAKNSSKNLEDCPIDIAAFMMMVPPAINPILYTVGTPKFLQLFSCLPRCQLRYKTPGEQRSLVAEPHLCTACCIVCYKRNKDRQSFSSESVQTSKLFTESSKRVVNELSFGISSSSEEG